jgi:hypothetical protein
VFAFASVTLAAMQVVIQVPGVECPPILATTAYRFAVAILVCVVCILGILLGIFIPIFYWDVKNGYVANKELARELRREGKV